MAEPDTDRDADAAPAEKAVPTADRKTKKKRRKKSAKKQTLPLDARGNERPRFVLGFPDDPELQRLVRAFEQGDYKTVRDEAPALAEKSESPEVRDAAIELRRRIDPDPLIRYLLLASVVLLGFLVLYVYTHRH